MDSIVTSFIAGVLAAVVLYSLLFGKWLRYFFVAGFFLIIPAAIILYLFVTRSQP